MIVTNCTGKHSCNQHLCLKVVPTAQAQQRGLSSIKFMIHLYKRKLVTDALMHQCTSYLLDPQHVEHAQLQCLCELMRAVGREIDSHPSAKESMTAYFGQIHHMMSHAGLSSQTCSMLQVTFGCSAVLVNSVLHCA